MNLVTVAGFVVGGASLVIDYLKEQQDKTEQQAYIDQKIEEGINKRMAAMNNTEEDV